MCERLKEGQTVTMLFGGRSMLPLINGEGDKIQLRPLAEGEKCVPGEVYLFRHLGHYIIHRLMWIKGDDYVFRGDNCYAYEHEGRENVLAKLIVIEKRETLHIGGLRPRKRPEVGVFHTGKHQPSKVPGGGIMLLRIEAVRSILYFVLLAILMWAPLNGLAPVLNNYIFGLRADHFLHATVFLFCPLFWADWLNKRWGYVLLVAVLTGLFTELVQALLPYRGYDVNDLIANCVGIFLGWLAILPVMIRHRRIMRNRAA